MSGKIIIVGLGSGTEEQLSLGTFRKLKDSNNLFLRTAAHPVVSFLREEGITFKTFDGLYDSNTEYPRVYEEIALQLVKMAEEGSEVVYAVPGNPMVAEKSVQLLIEKGKSLSIGVEVLGGESFLDTLFSRLQIDPIEGFLFFNGETLKAADLNPGKDIVIAQVYDKWIASDVKLTLMEVYPDDMPIWIAANLGTDQEQIKEVLLFELDHHQSDFHHLSSLYIKKAQNDNIFHRQFQRLVETVEILRSPNGCPWDRAQTHQSIRQNLIEETYELLETIDEQDMNHMIEELGDVMLQVILHSQIAREEGFFDIADVVQSLNQKLIRRHPHVFGGEKADKASEALEYWENSKKKEKKENNSDDSVLAGIPKDLPAILKAYKLQKKAAKVNFDWEKIEQVYSKIEEELKELQESSEREQIDELGDVLFAVVNLARFLKLDPEMALEKTNKKFIKRFNYIEKKLKENGISLADATLELMDSYWNEAKRVLAEAPSEHNDHIST